MPAAKISELPDISLPLNGTEELLITEDDLDSQYPVSALLDTIRLTPYTNNTRPTAPATGVTVYAADKAGRMRPSWVTPSGRSYSVQALLGENKCGFWSATGDSIAAHNTITGPGATRINFGDTRLGTATVRSISTGASNPLLSAKRMGFVTTGAANAQAGTRHAVQQFSRQYGFDFIIRFGFATPLPAGSRFFVGFLSATTAMSATTDPTNNGNSIGLLSNAADDFLSIYGRTNGTTNTKIPLNNTTFPLNTGNVDLFELRLFCSASDLSVMNWAITNLSTEAFLEGTLPAASLPTSSFLLSPQITVSQGATAGDPIGIDVVNQYIETDI